MDRRKKSSGGMRKRGVLTQPPVRGAAHVQRRKAVQIEIPNIRTLEAGAGEGDYSSSFRNQYTRKKGTYVATDIARQAGPTGFLRVAKTSGVRVKYGVDALELSQQVGRRSLQKVVAANPYGAGRYRPGIGFGIMKYRKVPRGAEPEREPDDRFVSSALRVMKPQGEIVLMGRTNLLHQKMGVRGPAKLDRTNPYMNIAPDHLEQLSVRTSTQIEVSAITPPKIKHKRGGGPDTPWRPEIGDFNTQLRIRKSGDRPGVTYVYGGESVSTIAWPTRKERLRERREEHERQRDRTEKRIPKERRKAEKTREKREYRKIGKQKGFI